MHIVIIIIKHIYIEIWIKRTNKIIFFQNLYQLVYKVEFG